MLDEEYDEAEVLKNYNKLLFYNYDVKGLTKSTLNIAICSNSYVCSENTICGNYSSMFDIIDNI